MKKFQILIFGASSTHGNWDIHGGWAERVRAYVTNKILSLPDEYHGHVFNLGVPGDGAADMLKRVESEIRARLFYPETMIIVSVGTNDSRTVYANKQPLISEQQFVADQQKILDIAKKYSKQLLFVGLTRVDEKRTNPWHDHAYVNERVKKFNDMIHDMCEKNGIDFLDLYQLSEAFDPAIDIYDGLHPSVNGHKKIFEWVVPYIDKFLK
jgi:lysophospholipase L1-like esterase